MPSQRCAKAGHGSPIERRRTQPTGIEELRTSSQTSAESMKQSAVSIHVPGWPSERKQCGGLQVVRHPYGAAFDPPTDEDVKDVSESMTPGADCRRSARSGRMDQVSPSATKMKHRQLSTLVSVIWRLRSKPQPGDFQ